MSELKRDAAQTMLGKAAGPHDILPEMLLKSERVAKQVSLKSLI